MRKTLLAALIGASVFAVLPALAQVRLGGAGQVGAGATAAGRGTVGAVAGPAGIRAGDALQRADRRTRRAADQATGRSHRPLDRRGGAEANLDAQGSAAAGGRHAHAHAGVRAGAGVDAGAAADHASGAARGIGGQVSDSAHAAIDGTGRTAGSVGDAVRRTATGRSVGADAEVRARTGGRGH